MCRSFAKNILAGQSRNFQVKFEQIRNVVIHETMKEDETTKLAVSYGGNDEYSNLIGEPSHVQDGDSSTMVYNLAQDTTERSIMTPQQSLVYKSLVNEVHLNFYAQNPRLDDLKEVVLRLGLSTLEASYMARLDEDDPRNTNLSCFFKLDRPTVMKGWFCVEFIADQHVFLSEVSLFGQSRDVKAAETSIRRLAGTNDVLVYDLLNKVRVDNVSGKDLNVSILYK